MHPSKTLRALTSATPLAIAAVAVIAAAAPASAGIADASVNNPHVLNSGSTLGVAFSSNVTDQAADSAIAGNVADALGDSWLGGIVDYALAHAPKNTVATGTGTMGETAPAAVAPSTATCRVTVTATDPDGATGSTSANVTPGITSTQLNIPDQAPNTKWATGDLDQFNVNLTCTDGRRGNEVTRATIAESEYATTAAS